MIVDNVSEGVSIIGIVSENVDVINNTFSKILGMANAYSELIEFLWSNRVVIGRFFNFK